MASTEPNVAYDGTSSDLGFGAAYFFKPTADFDNMFGLDNDLFGSDFMTSVNTNEDVKFSTISPQEIMMDSMDSVPSSTAFPELTPGSEMLETPNTTPLFTDSMAPLESNWSSLFPEETSAESPVAPTLSRQDSTSSQIVVHAGGEPRKSSIHSASASPMTFGGRPSAVAGIRKKSKPLPAIVVDEADPVAVKRARNTAAARKSREKKNAHVETLEARIAELEAMVEAQKAEITQLKGEGATAPATASTFNQDAFNQDFDLSALL